MRARAGATSLALAAAVCLALPRPAPGGGASDASARSELSSQERRGKQIYLKGLGGDRGEIRAVLGGDFELPATALPCASCHGPAGEGTSEGGLQPPPVTWAALTAPHTSPLTGRSRGPYGEASLARAIHAGLDPAGARLHAGMPRYRMAAGQMADLIAYLKRLGSEADTEPGLSGTTIRVGAALPMTGALGRIGEDVKGALTAYFAEVNASGGIYGRKFELVVEDSHGEPWATVEATRRLVESGSVFALVASFEPRGSDAADELLGRTGVPLVGPIALSPRQSRPPNRYVFYLLSGFEEQARVLVDFVASRPGRAGGRRGARLAVVFTDSELDADSVAGVRAQAGVHAMEIVAEHRYEAGRFSAAAAMRALAGKEPDYVFFFGSARDIDAFARELERTGVPEGLLGSAFAVGHGAFSLPLSVAARTFLAYPSLLPGAGDPAEFAAVMQRGNVALRSPAFQGAAYAAARVLVEATKRAGRRLSREALVSALEQLREFRTGVVPPVTFGPNRRVGSSGSYVVGIDPAGRRYVPLSDWLVPKDAP